MSIELHLYILLLQKVTLWKKVHVIYSFFLVRKIVAHIVTFVFYCVVMPATVLVPEVEVPRWGAVYIPSIVTLLNAVGTPRSHTSLFMLILKVSLDDITLKTYFWQGKKIGKLSSTVLKAKKLK